MGTLPEKWKASGFSDILKVEWLAWAPLLALVVVLGLFPGIIFDMTSNTVEAITSLPLLGG
jgi:NADH:ubiquinone oxidoreductase subunit 4 (subunit M)